MTSKEIIIITGANKGIGLATAHWFLEKGFTVIGTGRSAFTTGKPDFHYYPCDVRSFDACRSLIELVNKEHGDRIAALVNNAGLGYSSPVDEMDPDLWHKTLETNVNGVFYMTHLVVPHMKKHGKGHIFNIASIAGTVGIETMSAYCASKFAVRGFSQSIYKELRPFGIKVTTINPGSVQTAFFDHIPAVEANDSMMRPEDIAQTIGQQFETHPNYHVVEIEMRPLKPRK